MRFLRLELIAFGHFADTVLELSSAKPGFHLVYGDNEAGKSTSLRAVRGFLYGIPHNSQDVFVHEGADVRVAAEVLFDDGYRLRAVRRKGRKNTLLDSDGVPLDESVFSARLAEPNLFNAMFGLDHETLRQGAQELLEGKAGESLFGAGMGTGSVRKLLSEFESAADGLFTPKSRKLPINEQIERVREARRVVAQTSTSATHYIEQERALAALLERRDEVAERRRLLRAERGALERRLRVLPLLARRFQLQQQRTDLGELPTLPPEAAEQRLAALRARDEASQQAQHEQVEIERVSRRLAALELNEALLGLDPALIDRLNTQLGTHKQAQVDLPKRQAEVNALRQELARDLRSLASELPVERAEELLLTKIEEGRVLRLCREKAQFDTKASDLAGKLKRAKNVVTQRDKELARLPAELDGRPLRAALARATSLLGNEQRLHATQRRLERLERRLQQVLSTLVGYQGNTTQLRELSAITAEDVAPFEEQWVELTRRRTELESERGRVESERIESLRLRRELTAGDELPRRASLVELRLERDASFQALKDDPARYDETGGLIARCDELADQLFREASRVSRLGQLEAALLSHDEHLVRLEEQMRCCQERWQALEQQWRALWAPRRVEPESPRAMRQWLARRDEALSVVEERDLARDEARTLERQLAEATAALSEQLTALGEAPQQLWERQLSALTDRAQLVFEELSRRQAERADLQRRQHLESRQLDELLEEHEQLKEREKLWRGDWHKLLKSLRLDRDAGPDEVVAVKDKLTDLARKLEQMRTLEGRIAGMQRNSASLQREVHKQLTLALPEHSDMPFEEGCELLIRQSLRARSDQEEHERSSRDLARRQEQRRLALAAQARAEAELARLVQLAGARDVAELPAIEERVQRARQLAVSLRELEDEIVGHGEGASLSDLIEQTRGQHADAVRNRIDQIDPELLGCDAELEGLGAEILDAERSRESLQAGALRASEELAAASAELVSTVRQYVKLRLGATLLRREVERYREQHQGPVLRRASELFPRLTLGAYSTLRVGFDKRDEQVLECVRADGRAVLVEGLSDGARDQLYLALRLASLERYVSNKPSMPLVLDDVLVHFDDQRASAALSVLADLAERVQVLFFTHHRRIVELAEKVMSPDLLRCHRLDSGGQVKVA